MGKKQNTKQVIASSALVFTLILSVQGILHAQLASVQAGVDEVGNRSRPNTGEQASANRAALAPDDLYSAKLGPGFLLALDVFGVPEYSGLPPMRVDANGDISIAGVKPVHVAGLTITEAESAVTRAFIDQQILINPLVRLSVYEYTAGAVAIFGEVQIPGRYPILAPRALTDVLSRAGGITDASAGEIEVQHTDLAGKVNLTHVAFRQRDSLEKLRGIQVNPGDSVYVRRAGVVYVMGAVNRSGGFLMIDGGKLSVYEALALAGGMQINAGGDGLVIIRPQSDGNGYQQIKVPFSKIARGNQELVALRQDDVLFVPRSGVKVTLLDGASIVGAALSGAFYALR